MGLTGTNALTIILGAAVLTVGILIQKQQGIGFWKQDFPRSEGFQATSMTSPPKIEIAPSPPPPEGPPPPLPKGEGSESDELKRKVNEIRHAYNMVLKNQPKADMVYSLAMDQDTLQSLSELNEEIQFFLGKTSIPEYSIFISKLDEFDSLPEDHQDTIRQMITSGEDNVKLLQSIYVTIPVSNVTMGYEQNPDLANPQTAFNPGNLKGIAAKISDLLSGYPKLSTKITELSTQILGNIKNMTTDNFSAVQLMFNQFDRLVNLRLVSLQKTKKMQDAAKNANLKDEELTKMISMMDTNKTQRDIDELTQMKVKVLTSMKDQIAILRKASPANIQLLQMQTNVDNIIQQTSVMNAAKFDMERPPASMSAKEGFTSQGNPYNAPSPNLTQAYNFRLGKRELVADVSSTSLIR